MERKVILPRRDYEVVMGEATPRTRLVQSRFRRVTAWVTPNGVTSIVETSPQQSAAAPRSGRVGEKENIEQSMNPVECWRIAKERTKRGPKKIEPRKFYEIFSSH